MSTLTSRAAGWFKHHLPTREKIESNRFLRPFAHRLLRSELWRFTRRSVPRGVALGLFVGIMIPLAHFVTAAFLAIFVRANIPAAMAATFIGFPAFLPVIIWAGDRVGSLLLRVDAATVVQPISQTMQRTETGDLLSILTRKGPTAAFGMLVIATVLASLGYVVTSFGWRWWIGRKRRLRIARAAAARRARAAA